MLISDDYKLQMQALHQFNPLFGSFSSGAATCMDVLEQLMTRMSVASLLDYGAGKGVFAARAREMYPAIKVHEYDPGIPEKDADPPKCDLVFAIDVMEHIEPNCLPDVLAHIASKTNRVFFALVSTRPANKNLPDGRNAHLIVKDHAWWVDQIGRVFEIGKDIKMPHDQSTILGFPK